MYMGSHESRNPTPHFVGIGLPRWGLWGRYLNSATCEESEMDFFYQLCPHLVRSIPTMPFIPPKTHSTTQLLENVFYQLDYKIIYL